MYRVRKNAFFRVIVFACLIGFGLSITTLPLAAAGGHAPSASGGATLSSRLIPFLGRFHPVVLHVPIGILIAAFMLEMLARVRTSKPDFRAAISILLGLGTASAILAALLGLALANAGEYASGLIFWHKWLGIATAVLAVLTFFMQRKCARHAKWKSPYLITFFALMLVLMLGGHKGGQLTHGVHFLTELAPWNTPRTAAKSPSPTPTDAGVFASAVEPILAKNCYSCHGAEKRKGKLRLDSPDAIRTGGEHGLVLIPGKPDKSSLYMLATLAQDDPDVMPQKGRVLNADELATIKEWIQAGADFGDGKDTPAAAENTSSTTTQTLWDRIAAALPEPDKNALTTLRAAGVSVRAISQNRRALDVDFSHTKKSMTEKEGNAILKLAAHIVWLDMGGTDITDTDLVAVKKLKNLRRLHLERTKITDSGLAALRSCANLEYLNLNQTQVTDAGLRHLFRLTKLRSVYLWQAKTTPAGAKALRQRLPKTIIHSGK